MRTRRLIASTLCLLASAQVYAGDPVASMPRAFIGEWDVELAACKSREGDGHLAISVHRLEFYESVGTVRSVRARAPRDFDVVARMSGEGETSVERLHLQLSKDGETLSWLRQGQPMVYHRCPASSR